MKDDIPNPGPPMPPAADEANNVCVMSQRINGQADPFCFTNAPWNNSEECSSSCDVTAIATKKLKQMVDNLNHGISGVKYTVLDSGMETYHSFSCGNGSNYRFEALLWAKYDCRGIAVDVKIFGPYPSSTLTAKKAEHERDLLAEGYVIAYSSYDRVDQTSNMYYITFYAYKPNAKNQAQKNAVEALQDATLMNQLAGLDSIPLYDSLKVAKALYPEIETRNDYNYIKNLVRIARMSTIRATPVKK